MASFFEYFYFAKTEFSLFQQRTNSSKNSYILKTNVSGNLKRQTC